MRMSDLTMALFGLAFAALILVGVPYLLISHHRLKARVARLEAGLAARQAPLPLPESTAPDLVPDMQAERETVTAQTGASAPILPETKASEVNAPPRAFVLRADRLAGLWRWLRGNWTLAVAGVSLALAGVFMVQYGVEQGLLTPLARIIGALGLGAALIGGGEVIRRRHGDGARAAGVPSVLSGAGIVTLFAAVLAARALYGLIGPGLALSGLVSVGAMAIVLGWFYGPVMTALGLIGAGGAPFLVGGASEAAWMFYYYFALIAGVGLAVDAQRRWAWISVLALAVAVAGAALLYQGGTGGEHYLGFWALAVLLAVLVPEGRLLPQHAGNSLSRRLIVGGDFPDFPARLALAMVALASIATVRVALDTQQALLVWLAFGLLALMLAALLLGTWRAPALEDAALAPAVATLVLVALEALERGSVWGGFQAAAERLPETPIPLAASILFAGGVVASWLCHGRIRSREAALADILWALAAAVTAPALALLLELLWAPGAVIGGYAWALHLMALAGVMVWWAQGARGPQARLLAALFAGAALVLITLALFVMLSKAALTLALAVMVLATAMIDRRFDLPLLGGLAQIGVAVIGYRLVIDPGLGWAVREASLLDVLLAHGGPLVLLAVAWGGMASRARGTTRGVIESALWSILAILVSVLLQRWLGKPGAMGHAGLGLLAVVWLATMMVQLYRHKLDGSALMRGLRLLLAVGSGAVALASLAAQAVLTNPLFPVLWRKELVSGPPILDSLAAAYLPVAAVLAVGAWRLRHLPRWLRGGFAVAGAAYAAWSLGLEIRRLWQGRDLSVSGVSDGELYSYTVALIVLSVLLLGLALIRRSEALRRMAMAAVALTVVKVFVIDMSGLAGLVRVASFLGLGLSLAGLAWLNARIAAHMGRD